MKCPNCRCEIGNLTECPYCGARLYRRLDPTSANRTQPIPNRARAAANRTRRNPQFTHYTPEQRRNRHINNMDTWGLLTVILLSGIFLMQLLELILIGMQFGS